MFDFFGLPRELRDRCYEEMLVPEIELPSKAEYAAVERRKAWLLSRNVVHRLDLKPTASVLVLNAPAPALRTLSRQFEEEYMSAARRKAVIVIRRLDDNPAKALRIPAVMGGIRNLHFSTTVVCCGWGEWYFLTNTSVCCHAESHFTDILELAGHLRGQLQHPKLSIEVEFDVKEKTGTVDELKRASIEESKRLIGVPGMQSLFVSMRVYGRYGTARSVVDNLVKLELNGGTGQLETVATVDIEAASLVQAAECVKDERENEGGER